jgi:hypothetical protein
LLTWITGKPLHPEEVQLLLPRWVDVCVTPVLAALAGLGLAQLAALNTVSAWPGILGLWLVLVGLLRKMQVTHMHHAIHNRLFDRPIFNKVYATLVPALLFIQNGAEYRKEHLEHHNARVFTTQDDADAAFLAKLGFLPGRSRGELWINLWMTVLSPVADLPAHDWHHLAHLAGQNSRDWQRSLYLRQAAIANGDRAAFSRRELWGLPRMIDHQFGWLESIVCRYEFPTAKSQTTEA